MPDSAAPPAPPAPPQTPPPEPKPPAKPKPGDGDEGDDGAVEARIAAAVTAERNRIAAEELKKQRKKEEDEAKARGEHERLYNAEKAAREDAEVKARAAVLSEQVSDALADVAAEHEGYSVKVLKTYVKPIVMAQLAVDAEAPDAVAISKATKAAVDQYVKDNPRTAKGAGGAPPQQPHGQRLPASSKPNGKARSEVALRHF